VMSYLAACDQGGLSIRTSRAQRRWLPAARREWLVRLGPALAPLGNAALEVEHEQVRPSWPAGSRRDSEATAGGPA
jgi:hypothetical protein